MTETTHPRPKRMSKKKLRIAAALAGAAAFALPWGVLQAVPKPPAPLASGQVVILPGGGRVVIPQGATGANGVRYVYVKAAGSGASAPASAAPTSTHASAAPKP